MAMVTAKKKKYNDCDFDVKWRLEYVRVVSMLESGTLACGEWMRGG